MKPFHLSKAFNCSRGDAILIQTVIGCLKIFDYKIKIDVFLLSFYNEFSWLRRLNLNQPKLG